MLSVIEHDLALMRASCSAKVQVKAAGGVRDLDGWTAKLRGEGVTFLNGGPEKFGDTRALFIEGPSREALELVEV